MINLVDPYTGAATVANDIQGYDAAHMTQSGGTNTNNFFDKTGLPAQGWSTTSGNWDMVGNSAVTPD